MAWQRFFVVQVRTWQRVGRDFTFYSLRTVDIYLKISFIDVINFSFNIYFRIMETVLGLLKKATKTRA